MHLKLSGPRLLIFTIIVQHSMYYATKRIIFSIKAKKGLALRNGGGKLFFTIRPEAIFFVDRFQLKYIDKLMEDNKRITHSLH